MNKILFCVLLFSLIGACARIEDGTIKPPLVHRIDIQQGNLVDQSMINKLRKGMDEKQVRFIMGTPLLIDPFHTDRWEYIYSFQKGAERREQRHITLYFNEGKLDRIGGDIEVNYLPLQEETQRTEKSVVVPDDAGDQGLLERWLGDVIPGVGKPKPKEDVSEQPESEPAETDTKQETAVDESVTTETSPAAATDTPVDTTEESAASEQSTASEATAEEQAEDSEPGFFGRLWDDLTGDDEEEPGIQGAETLEPEFKDE